MGNDPMPRGGIEGVADSHGGAAPDRDRINVPSATLTEGGVVPLVVGTGPEALVIPTTGTLAHASSSLEVPIVGDMEVIRASPEAAMEDTAIGGKAAADDVLTGDEAEYGSVMRENDPEGGDEPEDGSMGAPGEDGATRNPEATVTTGTGAFSTPAKMAEAPRAEHVSRPGPSASDALKLSRQGKRSYWRSSSSSSVAGSGLGSVSCS